MQLMRRFCRRQRRRGVRPGSFLPRVERLEDRRLLAAGWPGETLAGLAGPAEGESSVPATMAFDFGTAGSPVRIGMQRVTPGDLFGPGEAFGFLPDASSLTAHDQQRWGDHSRDFVSGDSFAFAVQLAAGGLYKIHYGFGDPLSARAQTVLFEGQVIETVQQTTPDYHVTQTEIQVSDDGLLELQINSIDATEGLLNHLIVTPLQTNPPPDDGGDSTDGDDTVDGDDSDPDPDVTPPPPESIYRLDFGTGSSPVKDGMTRVTDTDWFTDSRTFGFVEAESVGLAAVNHSRWGDHSGDYVQGQRIAIGLRGEAGSVYEVQFGFGDPFAARSQRILIEGQEVGRWDVPESRYQTATYRATVSDDGIFDIVIESTSTAPGLIGHLIAQSSAAPPPPVSCPVYDPTAADAGWVSIFPDSEAPLFEPEQHVITCSPSYTAGTNWGSLDERQVFAQRVSVSDPAGAPEYEFRIGKGSQLYSLRLADDDGGWQEAIATQRAGRAEWIDEVIQTVIVDTETNDRSSESTKNQIHQAGDYENVSGVGTFYSPVLKEAWLPEQRAFATLSWPQQAHIPSNFKSHFLLMQNVRDLGSGVLEVTYVYHNFSQEGEKADFLASPWLPLRTSTLPLQYRSLPDGTLQRDQRVWPNGTPVPIADTGGYFLATAGSNPDDLTLGIVFGTDENPAGQSSPTRFRWGRVDEAGRDFTVASVQKSVQLDPGDVFFQRYYLVANSLQNTRAIAQQLVSHVDQGYLSPTEEHLVDICVAAGGEITTACSGESVLVQASLVPRPDDQPLLVARRAQDGQRFVTNDPYLLARRPYLKEYEYDGLLGWVTGQQLRQLAAHPDPAVQGIFRLAVINEDPLAADDQGTTDEDTLLTLDVLGNDSDPDGDSLAIGTVTQGAHGVVTIDGDQIVYGPDADFHGSDHFTYTVEDGLGGTATARVEVTVAPVNDAPLAVADRYTTDVDTMLSVEATAGLLANDTDADGDVLTAALLTDPDAGPHHGSVTVNAEGSFDYVPAAGFTGTDSFRYTVSDGAGGSQSASVSITVQAVSGGPALRHGVAAVGSTTWTTVTLDHSYHSMVVIATPNYDVGSSPASVRIRHAAGDRFEMRVDSPGGAPLADVDVHYVVVEEGVYDEPGFKLEAVKFDTTHFDRKGALEGEPRRYGQSYDRPVVVGQVMSYRDPGFSEFWASGSIRRSIPSSSALRVGRHVGEDPNWATRPAVSETLGYLVIESTDGAGQIEGLPFVAAVGGDTVRGVTDGAPFAYDYPAMPNAKTVVASVAGMDGVDGGWAVLYGADPITPDGHTLRLAIDEDVLGDSERGHTTERVAYFIIDPPLKSARPLGPADAASATWASSVDRLLGNEQAPGESPLDGWWR